MVANAEPVAETAAEPAVVSMEDLVSLCKRRGFVFPSSEIYNGYAGFFDYGPLGVELKKNIKDRWWRDVVYARYVQSIRAGALVTAVLTMSWRALLCFAGKTL